MHGRWKLVSDGKMWWELRLFLLACCLCLTMFALLLVSHRTQGKVVTELRIHLEPPQRRPDDPGGTPMAQVFPTSPVDLTGSIVSSAQDARESHNSTLSPEPMVDLVPGNPRPKNISLDSHESKSIKSGELPVHQDALDNTETVASNTTVTNATIEPVIENPHSDSQAPKSIPIIEQPLTVQGNDKQPYLLRIKRIDSSDSLQKNALETQQSENTLLDNDQPRDDKASPSDQNLVPQDTDPSPKWTHTRTNFIHRHFHFWNRPKPVRKERSYMRRLIMPTSQ